MNSIQEVIRKWLSVAAHQHNEAVEVFALSQKRGDTLYDVQCAQFDAQIATEIKSRLKEIEAALSSGVPSPELVARVESVGAEAIRFLVNAHADPVGPPGRGWEVLDHVKATAAARVVLWSQVTLGEIQKSLAEAILADEVNRDQIGKSL